MSRSIIKKLEPKIRESDLQALDEAIREFCLIDPSSEAFRYPVNKNGEVSLPPDLRYINLRNLAEVMEKISNFFDGLADMMSAYLDNQHDMNGYYGE